MSDNKKPKKTTQNFKEEKYVGERPDESSTSTTITLEDIRGSSPEFPKIIPSKNHIILCNVDETDNKSSENQPLPVVNKHVWDNNHVKMPFSNENTYILNQNGERQRLRRWDLIIETLCKPMRTSYELEKAILSYNMKYSKEWKFSALHKLFNGYLTKEKSVKFFEETLPFMVNLALNLPNIVRTPVPLLRQSQNKSVSLSQYQISSLLANAFFCTFPHRNATQANSEYSKFSNINFNSLFQCDESDIVLEKLKCIIHYFNRIFLKAPTGVVSFGRHFVEKNDCPAWHKSKTRINSIPVFADSNGSIEDDGIGLWQINFATSYVGGGVLGYGCVQEEIRFVIRPELLVSMLFTEMLDSTEALSIIGCERYSNYSGYSDSFKWTSDHVDQTARDSNDRRKCGIIAIDAIHFDIPSKQYDFDNINRELNKAWVGFSAGVNDPGQALTYPGIATGNWGCGALKGTPQLKFLLQLLACCEAQIPMAHFSFGDTQLTNDIVDILNSLSDFNVTVGSLYEYICHTYKTENSQKQIFSDLLTYYKSKKNEKSSFFSKFTG